MLFRREKLTEKQILLLLLEYIMRKPFFLIMFIFLFLQGKSFCQESQSSNQLIVTGKAEVLVSADQAAFSFSVTEFGPSLRAAVEKAKNKNKDISKKLLGIGLRERDLSTSYFYSSENFDSKGFLSSSKDFKATITVNVTIDSLQLLEEAILCLSESNVENITSITFMLRNFREAKEKARFQAIENAKTKAAQIAERIGRKLGSIKQCEEIDESVVPYYMAQNPFNTITSAMQRESGSSSGFFSKTITITGAFKMIYELEK
jgi:Uncharacterized conserved protein